MATADHETQVTINIDREFHARLSNCLPWGMRGNIMRMLLLRVVEGVEASGLAIAGAIESGDFRFEYVPRESPDSEAIHNESPDGEPSRQGGKDAST